MHGQVCGWRASSALYFWKMKIPLPCDPDDGFTIHVAPWRRRNSSMNMRRSLCVRHTQAVYERSGRAVASAGEATSYHRPAARM